MVPDLTSLTLEDLRVWIEALNIRYTQLAEEQQATNADRRLSLGEAIEELRILRGPSTGPPGVEDIRAVRRYDSVTLGDNAGLALTLVLSALEQLTDSLLDVAHVMTSEQ